MSRFREKTTATLLIAIFMTSAFTVMCEAKSSLLLIQASLRTEVEGIIDSDANWVLSNSPYIVMNDIVVEPGVLLNIEPGVVILFSSGTSLIIDGTLIANGDSSNKIIFTSNNLVPDKGDWKRIIFRETSHNSSLNWSIIEYAGGRDYLEQLPKGAIITMECKLIIQNSILRFNQLAVYSSGGLWTSGGDLKPVTIINCTFENNDLGISGYDARIDIINSNFMHNKIGVEMITGVLNATQTNFEKNEIAISSGRTLIMDSCNITNNINGVLDVFYNKLTNCIISDNEEIGFRPDSPGQFTFERCIITGNKNSGIVCEGWVPHPKEIHKCSIYNNTPFNIINKLSFGDDIHAENNWWGTTDEEKIKESIYDYYDDFNLGRVLYKPYLELEPSAKFELSDIIILPNEIELGNNITISFVISNIGKKSGGYAFILDIEGPEYVYKKSLDGFMENGFSEVFSHRITPDKVGDYFVKVDGLTSGFTVTAPIPPKPAEFVVSDLSITPEEAEIWEEIEISFTVTNVGEETGNYQFSLLIEEPYAAESVEMVGVLGAGESEIATYKFIPQNFGYYKIEVDELTEVFSLKAPILTPAEFEFSNLEMAHGPPAIVPGESIMVSATITNIGEMGGIQIVELKLDGLVVDSRSFTVNGGGSELVTFTFSAGEVGEHMVEIDGLSERFTVTKQPLRVPATSFWDKIPGFPYESIIIGLIAVIIIIWRVRSHGGVVCLIPAGK